MNIQAASQAAIIEANNRTYEVQKALETANAALETLSKRVTNLQDEAAQARTMWTKLNEHMNEAADENNLCDQYEAAIADWNGNVPSRFELVGRSQELDLDFEVNVVLTVPGSVTKEQVQDMLRDIIITEVDNNTLHYIDGAEDVDTTASVS